MFREETNSSKEREPAGRQFPPVSPAGVGSKHREREIASKMAAKAEKKDANEDEDEADIEDEGAESCGG